MRVFCIGLSRTGTQSLADALRTLGFTAIHYPVDVVQIDRCDASLDITVARRFRFLDAMYPAAKFILTTRALAPWLKSCQWHYSVPWRDARPEEMPLEQKLLAENDFEVYGTWRFDADLFTRAKHAHEARVAQHFLKRPDDLLVLDITATPPRELWQRLVVFLERDPNGFDFGQPFPWENRSEPQP